jgi:hypothetical protein
MSTDFTDALKIAGNKHDLAALRVYDNFEKELPDLGLAYFKDLETGQQKWVDTSLKNVRREYRINLQKQYDENTNLFKKSKLDFVDIRTDQDYVKPLITLFKNR